MEHKKVIVMVSGGVDSMVLLDVLVHKQLEGFSSIDPAKDVLVAHVNHGMRDDSGQDEELVKQQAGQYGVACESVRLGLGSHASEAEARHKRYAWIEQLRKKYSAEVVLTAHHEDDLVETCILQVMRGTFYRGLVPFEREGYARPLLNWTKAGIYAYARRESIEWREDSTNTSTDYLRNYIRQHIIPKLGDKRQHFLAIYKNSKQRKEAIEQLAAQFLEYCLDEPDMLRRQAFVWLPFAVRKELVTHWLRLNGCIEFDTKLIERATLACAVARPNTMTQLRQDYYLDVKKHHISLKKVDRRLV